MKQPKDIIAMMMDKDQFSQWLGIQVNHIALGSCSLSCTVKKDMLNGFSIAHGGISYALADSTLAFAANSRGIQCYSIETSISHLKKVFEQDLLTTIKQTLHKHVPKALHPKKVSLIENWPTTIHGKIDRQALLTLANSSKNTSKTDSDLSLNDDNLTKRIKHLFSQQLGKDCGVEFTKVHL